MKELVKKIQHGSLFIACYLITSPVFAGLFDSSSSVTGYNASAKDVASNIQENVEGVGPLIVAGSQFGALGLGVLGCYKFYLSGKSGQEGQGHGKTSLYALSGAALMYSFPKLIGMGGKSIFG